MRRGAPAPRRDAGDCHDRAAARSCAFLPGAEGLFDPKREYDACGVGFIADLKGGKSHKIVEDALAILCNVEHRGAVGADPITGDGAGIIMQIPHAFLAEECARLKIKLPEPGNYAVGHIFMPQDERLRAHCERVWMRIIREEGLEFLGWRSVPVDNSCLSEMVKAVEPCTGRSSSAGPRAWGPARSSSGGSI